MSDLMIGAFLDAVEVSDVTNAPKPIVFHLEDNEEWSAEHHDVSARGGLDTYNAHICYTHIIYQLGKTIVLMEYQEHDFGKQMNFYKIQ